MTQTVPCSPARWNVAALRAVVLMIASVLLTGEAVPQDTPPAKETPATGKPPRSFAELDADSSGMVSVAEFLADSAGQERSTRRREFFLRDQNGDGSLNETEASVAEVPARMVPASRLAFMDSSGDGALDAEEFLRTYAEVDAAKGQRDFRLADADGSGMLTLSELARLPQFALISERTAFPDHSSRQVEELLGQIESQWPTWDADADGMLSDQEFKAGGPGSVAGTLAGTALADWDRDADGKLSPDECRWRLEVAFGVRRPQGELVRFPSGVLVNWMLFNHYDKDRDGAILKAEFLEQRLGGDSEEDHLAHFSGFDLDGDERLTFGEWSDLASAFQSGRRFMDPVAEFQRVDTDVNGKISREELQQGTPAWLQPVAAFLLPGFDLDQDGALSLDEYRDTPPVNRVAFWQNEPRDRDGNGQLSLDEFRSENAPALTAVFATYFARLDVDGSGQLGPDEYFYSSPRRLPIREFRKRDADQDGLLTEAEFLTGVADDARVIAQRDFRLVDFDGSGALSPAEFHNIPPVDHVNLPGELPDPVAELAVAAVARVTEAWTGWDQDQNGTLSEAEFTAAKPGALVPGLEAAAFPEWDLDADGQISVTDARGVVESGYGLRRRTGEPLRTTSGLVISLAGFHYYDQDDDEKLSWTEAEARMNLTGDDGRKVFDQYDTDADGFLTFTEFTPRARVDVLQQFRGYDTDLDARLSPSEWMAGVPVYVQRIARPMLLAADSDGDGYLSFREYRLTPQANPLAPWHEYLPDRNRDGVITPDEFPRNAGIELAALARLFFTAFDRSRDGVLTRDEFPAGPSKFNPEGIFGFHDANGDGTLSLEEFAILNADQALISREFRLFDDDGNERLSEAEFRSIPWLFPPDVRAQGPDPVAELAEQSIAAMAEKWVVWDSDGSGRLDEAEFQKATLRSDVPGLDRSEFTAWDLDEDGQIGPDDASGVLRMAFGLRRKAGEELRTRAGIVYSQMGFRWIDQNSDQHITWEEAEARAGLKEDAGRATFAELDTDGDKQLSFSEYRPRMQIEPVQQFRQWDTSLDARLDRAEVLAALPNYSQNIGPNVFDAFDADHDGLLDLREFLLTPLANPLLPWHETRADANGDGVITPEEFVWNDGLELIALNRVYFDRLDLDHNGQLTLDEFPSRGWKWNLEGLLRSLDTNADGLLSQDEFVSRETQPEQARRDFLLFDVDHDGLLTDAELHTVPRFFPLHVRGPLPDPVVDLVDSHWKPIAEQWTAWDRNGNGLLESTEWSTAGIPQRIPGLKGAALAVWDGNLDGAVSQDEVRRTLEIAFAVRRPQGDLIRHPSGRISWWMTFKHFDRDGQPGISLDEVMQYGWTAEKSETRFKEGDADGDGTITFAEWDALPYRSMDAVQEFLRLDRDLDGHLTAQELTEGTLEYLRTVARRLLPGFDTDGDGVLSMYEFRLTPLANFPHPWHSLRNDTSRDGVLTLDEFRWEEGIDAAGLVAEYFARLDANHDQRLDLDEWEFRTDYRNPERDFQQLDADASGQLDEGEFTGKRTERELAIALREFRLFDADGDAVLSFDEYLTIPGRAPPLRRRPCPDPIAARADAQIAEVEALLNSADSDGDGLLTRSEFDMSRFPRRVSGFELTGWNDWDRDRDGRLNAADCCALLEAAWGLRRGDGLPLRTSAGLVVNWMHYRHVDEDNNDRLSRDEFTRRGYFGDQAAERFAEADTDGDGQVTFTEWSSVPVRAVDGVADFLRFDTDLDGQLSRDEIMASSPEWQRTVTERLLPAFDLDDDGLLSMNEYLATPVVWYLVPWHSQPGDRDNDGYLSLGEFTWSDGLELTSLYRWYFTRLDTSGDQKLGLDEFTYRINAAKAPAEIVFLFRDTDRDGQLTLDESLAGLDPESPSAQHSIARIEDAFRAADRDSSGFLSKLEFLSDAGKSVVDPSAKPRNLKSMTANVQSGQPVDPVHWRQWAIAGLNVVLIAGVAVYLFRKK